ncbi:MAG: hypothetical protein MJA29_12245, partial [Candidatus Omnitrophica bacterium]|nr:hypothetical protein [Candidatus Omnitrophota bacterium]
PGCDSAAVMMSYSFEITAIRGTALYLDSIFRFIQSSSSGVPDTVDPRTTTPAHQMTLKMANFW